jgi:hypothetical protein
MIAPVICSCSGKSTHTKEHEECRCNGWVRFRNGFTAPYPQRNVFVKNNKDGPWELCRYCGKVRDFPKYLVTCPNCSTKFRGPRPYFPIDFECEKCE